MTVGNDSHNNHSVNNNLNSNSSNKTEFVKCMSEFFKRDLVSIPVIKKYPHAIVQQRCGLKAATLELDTASYPNIEYVAGTRLSVYPANPAAHVQSIMEHLIDDISCNNSNGQRNNIALPPNSEWWSRFVHVHKGESLKLALTYLFDIMTAPTRDIIKLLLEFNFPNAKRTNDKENEFRNKLVAISSSNEAWEKWLCSGHRTLKSLFDELPAVSHGKQTNHKQGKAQLLLATRLLSELEIQQPRQYSVSNIKSSKRFRTEIIVFQHKFNLRQIELNLRQLRERQTFDNSVSSPKSPQTSSSRSSSNKAVSPNNASTSNSQRSQSAKKLQRPRASSSPGGRAVAKSSATVRNVAEASGRSTVSMRSIRSLAPFATSPPISTHQVKRVPSFSGPLMSMYATASSTPMQPKSAPATGGGVGAGPGSTLGQRQEQSTTSLSATNKRDHRQMMHSKMSLLSAPEFSANSDPGQATSPSAPAAGPGRASSPSAAPGGPKFDGLCSNYLLNLNTNDTIICEFVENPRFTLKGNRERPIMMIGQDVGLIAFRPFWQQRNLEHDRAQVFYTLFKDLSPKKFGEMQLVCLTGHKSRIEELLFRREINAALTSKVLSSVTYLHRKHLVSILSAAHHKSQLVFSLSSQSEPKSSTPQRPSKSPATAPTSKVAAKKDGGSTSSSHSKDKMNNDNNISMQITDKELLELGDRIYKLLMENHGCLYTCCDPHMTQAIELLTFESVVRNNPSLTRERVMQLLPSWKGRGQNEAKHVTASSQDKSKKAPPSSPAIYTLENTYERAKIVQEIYDSSI